MDITLVVDPGRRTVTTRSDAEGWSGEPVLTWTPAAAWVGPEGEVRVGRPAVSAGRRSPDGLLHGWIAAITGGPAPSRLAEHGVTAPELLSDLLLAPVRVSVLGLGADPRDVERVTVGVITPDGVDDAGRDRLVHAVRAAVEQVCPGATVAATSVLRSEALRRAAHHDGAETLAVVDVAQDVTTVDLLGATGAPLAALTAGSGSEAWNERLLDHLAGAHGADVSSPDAAGQAERALEGLAEPGAHEVSVTLAGVRHVLTTEEADEVLAPEVDRVLALARRTTDGAGVPDRILLLGPLAGLPVLARGLGSAFDVPVSRLADPVAGPAHGARAVLAGEPPAGSDDPLAWWGSEDEATAPRRTPLWVAAALVALAVAASLAVGVLTGAFDGRDVATAPTTPTESSPTSEPPTTTSTETSSDESRTTKRKPRRTRTTSPTATTTSVPQPSAPPPAVEPAPTQPPAPTAGRSTPSTTRAPRPTTVAPRPTTRTTPPAPRPSPEPPPPAPTQPSPSPTPPPTSQPPVPSPSPTVPGPTAPVPTVPVPTAPGATAPTS